MERISVDYRTRDRFRLRIRGHELVLDQPLTAGGDDMGPTPTELFVAGLAGCIGFYAERYLRRHKLSTDGLAVECSFDMSNDQPARVARVDVQVSLPEGFPGQRTEALLRVVDRCTVHNTLSRPPEILIDLKRAEPLEMSMPEVAGERR
jgi:putative redox protein